MKDFLLDIKTLFLRGTLAFPLLLVLAFGLIGYTDYILCLFSACVFLFCLKKIPIKRDCILLIVFAFTYTLIYLINGYYRTIPHTFGFFCSFFTFYIFGCYIVKSVPNERTLLNLLLLVTLLICTPYYIETIIDIRETSFINITRAMTLSGEEVSDDNMINATIIGLTVSFGLAGLGTFFSFNKKRVGSLYCWLFVAITVFSLLVNIHIVNRTAIVAFVACLMVSLYYQLRAKNSAMIIGMLLIILLLIVFLPDISVFSDDMVTAYQDRASSERSSFGNRPNLWAQNIPYLLTNPLGWREETGFAHNMWLDLARECGIIPFVIFISFTVQIIKNVTRLFYIKNSPLVCFLIGINTVILLYGFVEPVFQANRLFFYICCFIWGIQAQLLESKQIQTIDR